jgi:hypothetical protein
MNALLTLLGTSTHCSPRQLGVRVEDTSNAKVPKLQNVACGH